MEKYNLTIPQPAKAPTPFEELLKLDLLELIRKPQKGVHSLFDEVHTALRKNGMDKSHLVSINGEKVEVIRLQHKNVVLRLEQVKEVGHV